MNYDIKIQYKYDWIIINYYKQENTKIQPSRCVCVKP